MRYLSIFTVLFLAIAANAQRTNVVVTESEGEPARTTLRARVFFEDTGRPVRRTSVILLSDDGSGGPGGGEGSGMTDDLGNLVVKGLKAGKYYAIVNLPGIVTPLSYLRLDERKPELGSIENEFQPIMIDGLTDAFASIGARRGGIVSGRVMYSDGDPASGVKVEVLRKNDDGFNVTIPNFGAIAMMMMGGGGSFQTDDRGVFRVAGLPAGEYIVKVTQNAKHSESSGMRDMMGIESVFGMGSSMISVFFDNVYDKDEARVLAVGFGQEVSDVNIILPERGYHVISGKVVAGRDKLPISGASVSFSREGDVKGMFGDAPGMARLTAVATDLEGKFAIQDLPKGKYRLTVTADGVELDSVTRTYRQIGLSTGEDGMEIAAPNAAPQPPRPRSVRGSANSAPKPEPFKFAGRSVVFEIDDTDLADQVIELNFGASISGTIETADRKQLPSLTEIYVSDQAADLVSSASVMGVDYSYEETEQRTNTRQLTGQKEFKIDGIATGKKMFIVSPSEGSFYVKSATAGGRDLLSGLFDLNEGDVLVNVRIVIANDAGELKVKVIDDERQPRAGVKLIFLATDAAKTFNGSFTRQAVTDRNGEATVTLPPFEYAILFDDGKKKKATDETRAATLEQMKEAQKVKVDAKGSSTITLKYQKPGQK